MFDIGQAINGGAAKALDIPFIRTIAGNPIYTSIIIVVIIMLVIAFITRDIDAVKWIDIFRIGFWAFIVSCSLIFFNNKVLIKEEAIKTAAHESGTIHDMVAAPVPATVNPRFIRPEPVVERPLTISELLDNTVIGNGMSFKTADGI